MGLDNLSQRSRFWLFVILTTGVLIGYSVLAKFLAGDDKAKKAQATQVEKKADKKDTAPSEKKVDDKQNVAANKEQEAVKPPEPVVNPREKLNQLLAQLPSATEHTLGDDTTKIKVVFTDRGAAIRNITLNEHEGSDRQTGQRLEADASGKRPRLVLVTDDEDHNRLKLAPSRQFELLSYRFSLLNEQEQVSPELAALPWKQLPGATSEKVSYSVDIPAKNLKVTKNFSLAKDTYHVEMELQFAAIDPAKPVNFTYELSGPQGLPVEGLRWKQFSFRNYVFATQDADKPTTVYRTMEGVEKLKKDGTPNSFTLNDPKSRKVFLFGGVMIQFFASLAVVDHADGEATPYLIDKVLAEYVGPDADAPEYYKERQGRMTTKLISTPVILDKGQPQSHKYLLYAGPTKTLLLDYEKDVRPGLTKRYSEELHLNQMTDATDVTWTSFFRATGITGLLVGSTNIMHRLLENLYKFVGNYGIAIILMTVIVRLLLFPLSRKQAQNQAKMQEQMKVIRPEMEALKKKYANDRQQYAMAQMELFKKHKMSPLAGCNGCWILLLQMPVFLGLYFALRESMHLRMSSFLWIDNLAMPDMLLRWGDNFATNLPISFLYLGPYLHILPIIAVIVMYVYQKLMAPPAMDEQQEQQIKMMNYMTLVMGLAFYWVAAGLCLYFIVSSLWGMVERRFVKKAKDQAIAQWQDKREKMLNNENKPAAGVRGKLGDLWRDLQNKADKRK